MVSINQKWDRVASNIKRTIQYYFTFIELYILQYTLEKRLSWAQNLRFFDVLKEEKPTFDGALQMKNQQLPFLFMICMKQGSFLVIQCLMHILSRYDHCYQLKVHAMYHWNIIKLRVNS